MPATGTPIEHVFSTMHWLVHDHIVLHAQQAILSELLMIECKHYHGSQISIVTVFHITIHFPRH